MDTLRSFPSILSLSEAAAAEIAAIAKQAIQNCGKFSLGLSGGDYSRGYIQHWLAKDSIPERSAQRIFAAADTILRAGRPDDRQPAEPTL